MITGSSTPKGSTASGGLDSKTLLDLGGIPLVNQYHETESDAINAKRYRLRAEIQKDKTINLDYEVPPHILYEGYRYNSGVNTPYVEHCRKMFKSFEHLLYGGSRDIDTIIDIGGNDGTLLKTFQKESKRPLRCINVDASDSFVATNEGAGIEYVNAFFSDELDLPKANVITSTNVFQHTKDIHKFLRGIVKYLDGIWILEFPYTLRTLQTYQFDQFYHEHYYYWLVTSLAKLFKQYGLKIIHAQEQDIHGGSMRLWMTNKEPSAPEGAADRFIKEESEFDYNAFESQVQFKIHTDRHYIQNLEGRVAFFGAAAKGCVYLNALGLNTNNMADSYVVDDTFAKRWFFIGGTGFQIKDRLFLYDDQPENLIILAHNFKDHIIKTLRPNYKGRIITMFPSITVDEYQP